MNDEVPISNDDVHPGGRALSPRLKHSGMIYGLSTILETSSQWGLRVFLLLVVTVSLRNSKHLFLPTHGRSHRLAGGVQFIWILVGAYACSIDDLQPAHVVIYDIVLGCLGTMTTLTAARDFPHRRVKNAEGQSGSLSAKAIVTQAEMTEHAFYQVLNLIQVVYLHGLARWTAGAPLAYRLFALFLATSPWWIRRHFPVHSFSNNWKKTPKDKRTDIEVVLYMIKKSQYVFYKHFVLHGLNISFALYPSSLPWTRSWRIFWLHLNVSYVMEFFLQSLVKRKLLSQGEMLWLQRLLITSATLSSVVPIFGTVRIEFCVLSLLLNFANRYHDVFNTMLAAAAGVAMQQVL
jgi:hypothetical protein